MKNSLRILSALAITLHAFLVLLLLWTASVPLEQIRQYAAENTGEISGSKSYQENIVQVQTLLWNAAGFTTLLGCIIPWLISRQVLNPLFSIRSTLGQVSRGDTQESVHVHAGKEFQALASELNRMLKHQKLDREKLIRLNRTLSAISACRHEMIRETDEMRLVQECCRILVDTGEYRMAWIGYVKEGENGAVTPAALAGYPDKRLNAAPEPWTEPALSPASRAVRNRHPAIIRDIYADPLLIPLQAEATRHGYASILSLPLLVNRQILGALTLHAGKPDAFDTEAVRLLTELADDLAGCIQAIRFTGTMNPQTPSEVLKD